MSDRRKIAGALSLLLVGSGCGWFTVSETARPLLEDTPLRFESVAVDFAHAWNRDHSHHLSGAAVLDIDGDGAEEVFVGGGHGQADSLLRLVDGRVVALPDTLGLSSQAATYGAVSLDWDADGDVDLFVCRKDGLTLYRREGERFRSEAIPLSLAPDAVPLAVTVRDMDADGDGDLYVSVFIDGPNLRSATFNDPDHAKPNILLRNDGAEGWRDITDEVTASLNNSFTSSFVDLDGDDLPELVVAQNTGEIEILANRGSGRFERVPVDTGFGFWMGLAVGDADADGDPDLFFTNVGNTIPNFLTQGDLRDDQRHEAEWLMLRNDGGLRFTDVTESVGLTGYGFAWGAVFEDVDLDGRLDLLVAQNYVKWPLHGLRKLPGKTLLDRGNAEPRYLEAEGLGNPTFGQSPVIVDLDGDARPDLLWLNNDVPSRAYLNRSSSPFLHVALPDDVASVGARVRLEGVPRSATHQIVNGTGLLTDSSPAKVFGLPPGTDRVAAVVVEWPDGSRVRITEPPLGEPVRIEKPARP